MTDEDAFAAAQEKRNDTDTKCQFCPAVTKLSRTRRQQLHSAMFGKTLVNGKKINYQVILGVLRDWGINTHQSIISKHVSGSGLSQACSKMVIEQWDDVDGE